MFAVLRTCHTVPGIVRGTLVLLVLLWGTARAQTSAVDGHYAYLPLTSFLYKDSPVKIGSPMIRYDSRGGFRAVWDVENTGGIEITGLDVWILLYFRDRSEPVLFEKRLATSISPDEAQNLVWEETLNGYGEPVSGVIVPYRIERAGDSDWRLNDYYASEARTPVSPADDGNASLDASPYNRRLEASKVFEPPAIDGKLDDPAWQNAEFQGNFLQREPREGVPASEKTEVAVIYDSENLYVGARLYDSEPEKIRATVMQRDGQLQDDDTFDMVFDTFRDKRNAFYFTTNPLGVRVDGTIGQEGRINNKNWDGVWRSKTSIDDKGWYVEVAIPWQTLRFREGGDYPWGAHFARRIRRKYEDDFWRLVPRGTATWVGQHQVSEAGIITGLRDLKMGGTVEFTPYVTGGIEGEEVSGDLTKRRGDTGLDMKINLTSTLTADFTYNTDFAQVESDQERVNLTRFDLFFPEKRQFFLEGAETFSFGKTQQRFGRAQAGALQLFHSRRIGIESGDLIPIIGGARLNGRAGAYTVGLLSIQSEDAVIDDGGEHVPETNSSVFRLKRDFFSRSSAGVMFLNKQDGTGAYNRVFGFDSMFNLTRYLSFFINGAGTYTSDVPDEPSGKRNNFAGHAGFNYKSDLWAYGASFLDIEPSFNPELGFIRRTDIKQTKATFSYSPRPKMFPAIRKITYTVEGSYMTNMTYRELNKKYSGRINFDFQSGPWANLYAHREFDYIDADWEIRENIIIPQGEYVNTNYNISYNTNRTRAVSGQIHLNGGEYYGGHKIGGRLRTDIKAMSHIRANIQYSYNTVHLPAGDFHTNTLSTRFIYSFNPDLFIKAYVQWYGDPLQNEHRDRITSNIVLRYIYRPGSNFYLVYNRQSLVGNGNDEVKNNTVLAKFTYLIRK